LHTPGDICAALADDWKEYENRDYSFAIFDIPHRVRRFYGRQLGIAGANGGYSYVALFYRNNRLYQVEGNALVAGGQAEVEAMRFQQSLDLT
jgi:hypothetical protein